MISATQRRAAGAQPNREGGSDSYLGSDVECAAQCAHNVAHDRQPESAASARALVVKNASKIRSSIAGGIPAPVSLIDSRT